VGEIVALTHAVRRELQLPADGLKAEIQASTVVHKVPGAIKMIIHGAGHLLNMEKQKELNQLVLSFLESLVPRGFII
jgi:pimeloyl-ACP methyl ester carboxylesterase